MVITDRSEVTLGRRVAIVQKKDQSSGTRTEGEVYNILTSSPHHPQGIKVQLVSGEIGRVVDLF